MSDSDISAATAVIVTELAMTLRDLDPRLSSRLVERLQVAMRESKVAAGSPLIEALIKDLSGSNVLTRDEATSIEALTERFEALRAELRASRATFASVADGRVHSMPRDPAASEHDLVSTALGAGQQAADDILVTVGKQAQDRLDALVETCLAQVVHRNLPLHFSLVAALRDEAIDEASRRDLMQDVSLALGNALLCVSEFCLNFSELRRQQASLLAEQQSRAVGRGQASSHV